MTFELVGIVDDDGPDTTAASYRGWKRKQVVGVDDVRVKPPDLLSDYAVNGPVPKKRRQSLTDKPSYRRDDAVP